MKRILLTLLLMCAIQVHAQVPISWSEFCPPEYDFTSPPKTEFRLTPRGRLKETNKTYWYGRKLQFQTAVDNCNNSAPEMQQYCVMQLRASENQKTQQREQWFQQEERSIIMRTAVFGLVN